MKLRLVGAEHAYAEQLPVSRITAAMKLRLVGGEHDAQAHALLDVLAAAMKLRLVGGEHELARPHEAGRAFAPQ